jgi:hypothetical protein
MDDGKKGYVKKGYEKKGEENREGDREKMGKKGDG